MRTKISDQITATAIEISEDARRGMQAALVKAGLTGTNNTDASERARWSGLHKIDGLQSLVINIGGVDVTADVAELHTIWRNLLRS